MTPHEPPVCFNNSTAAAQWRRIDWVSHAFRRGMFLFRVVRVTIRPVEGPKCLVPVFRCA